MMNMREGPPSSNPSPTNPDRRKFLKYAVAGGVTLATGAAATRKVLDAGLEIFSKEALESSIDQKAAFIFDTYGITVRFDTPGDFGEYESEESMLAQKERALTLLVNGLSVYPVFLIRESGLEAVYIRNGLMEKDDDSNANISVILDRAAKHLLMEIGGVVSRHGKARQMVINMGGGLASLYHLFGWGEEDAFGRYFAHEIFHAVDRFDNNTWRTLNDKRFRTYVGQRGKEVPASMLNTALPGFARGYGMMSVYEDRATVYEIMMSDPQELQERILKDPILSRKVGAIRDYFLEKSLGLMDGQYWIDRQHESIDSGYFERRAKEISSLDFDTFVSRTGADISPAEFLSRKRRLGAAYQ